MSEEGIADESAGDNQNVTEVLKLLPMQPSGAGVKDNSNSNNIDDNENGD